MSTAVESPGAPPRAPRIASIDVLRGLVMFTMIFVNDIAGVSPNIMPAWMRHYKGRSGMTFVDLVFPAFLFIVGMSIPFALGGRLRAGVPWWKTILHVMGRTLALLLIGILMVNDESPGPDMSGLSPTLWAVLMFLSAILAFCSISPPLARGRAWIWIGWAVRGLGLCGMVALAFMFRGDKGQRIITLSPFAIHTEWYGILGLIAWAYCVGSVVYLTFRANAVALLGCVVLLLGLYPADRTGLFHDVWLGRYLGIGDTLGALPSITVAGLLLASILVPTEKPSRARTVRFTLLFVLGFAAAAMLFNGLYGINKNQATPSWCLWACAITAALWLIFHGVCDRAPAPRLAKVLAVAGQNVLLAYLISEMLPSVLDLLHLANRYDALAGGSLATAIARSAGCAVVILCVTAGLNRAGFRLKL
jgi:heparan-alpha-glucosaminide N-acetyltransferase